LKVEIVLEGGGGCGKKRGKASWQFFILRVFLCINLNNCYELITYYEIRRIIYTIKPKTSTGSDGILSKLLHELSEINLEILA